MTSEDYAQNVAMAAIYIHEAAKYANWVKPHTKGYEARQMLTDFDTLDKKMKNHFIKPNKELLKAVDEVGYLLYDVLEAIKNNPEKRSEILAIIKAAIDGEIEIKD